MELNIRENGDGSEFATRPELPEAEFDAMLPAHHSGHLMRVNDGDHPARQPRGLRRVIWIALGV